MRLARAAECAERASTELLAPSLSVQSGKRKGLTIYTDKAGKITQKSTDLGLAIGRPSNAGPSLPPSLPPSLLFSLPPSLPPFLPPLFPLPPFPSPTPSLWAGSVGDRQMLCCAML